MDQFERARHALGHFGFGFVTRAQSEGDVLEDVEMREEGVVLKDHAEAASFGREIRDVGVLKSIVPESGFSRPAIIRSVVVLPQPDGPSSPKNSPCVDVERDVGDRARRSKAAGNVF